MVLDLDAFRDYKGGDLNKVKVNQEKRFKDLKLVETVVEKGIFNFHNLTLYFVIAPSVFI